MPHDLPIACTLDAADFAARERLMADLGRDALIAAEQTGRRAVLRFSAGIGIRNRNRVDSFVAGESQCCAFLTMHVSETADEVALTIDAPDGAEPVLAELVAAFG
jgi:hypothetical protein